MNSDLGIEILKYLCADKGGRVGFHYMMDEYVTDLIRKKGDVAEMNTWIAREIIYDLIKEGYVTVSAPNDDGLYNYGRHESEHRGQKGFTKFGLGITWKGKQFYYSITKKGILDRNETIGFYVITIATVITTVATIWLLVLTITQQCRTQSTREKRGQIEASIENPCTTYHDGNVSNKSTSHETLRAKEIDTPLLTQ